jgi:hypothetical protein
LENTTLSRPEDVAPAYEAIEALAEIQRWAHQVHDALDGRPLPEYPDEGPARIKGLKEQLEAAEVALREIAAMRIGETLAAKRARSYFQERGRGDA